MAITAEEGAQTLNDLRARFTLAAADLAQRRELVERAGWIGVELSGSQTRGEQKQWQALARDLLERRPGFDPERFVARATQGKARERGCER